MNNNCNYNKFKPTLDSLIKKPNHYFFSYLDNDLSDTPYSSFLIKLTNYKETELSNKKIPPPSPLIRSTNQHEININL